MKINRISIVIILLILSNPLYSGDYKNKVWLKPPYTICFDSLDVGKKGFIDSHNNIKIKYKLLDSLKTNDSELLSNLLKIYDFLDVHKRGNEFTVKGFENIRSNVINIGFEGYGKSIAGSIFLNYVYKEKHSFDIGYGNGYASFLFRSYKVKDMYYVSYSYLYGVSRIKMEAGIGLTYGEAMFNETAFPFPISETTGVYKGFSIPFITGLRYQRDEAGFFFKAGINPIIFTSPMIKMRVILYLGIGYTFEL